MQEQDLLTGFENHQGRTVLGDGVTPLARVLRGVGNGFGCTGEARPEGVRHGRVFGTYLHGPVLARHPHLADALLESAVGELAAFSDPWADELAAERRAALS